MSSANLDEIKKKYNFKDISVATWRNPALSVLPARGGPNSPGLSPDTAYIPTYKVNYDLLSQGTDDEEDPEPEGEEEQSELEVPPDLNLDEPFEDLPLEDREFDKFATELRSAEDNLEIPHNANADQSGPNYEQEHEFDSNSVVPETTMADEENKELPADTELPEVEVGAPGDDAQPDGSGALEAIPLELGEDSAAGARTPSEAGSDERRVSFAPGTPDPKPTHRKKKAAKGTKGKKKRIAVPLDSLPAEVMAMLDTAFEGEAPPPPPAPDAPSEGEVKTGDVPEDPAHLEEPDNNDVGDIEAPAKEDASSEVIQDVTPVDIEVASEPAHEPSVEATDEQHLDVQEGETLLESIPDPDANTDDPPADESVPDTIQDVSAIDEKPSKKKSSKSGKDKDKSKKKSSKSKTREDSPQPAGLGIELPPVLELGTTVQVEENPPLAGDTTDDLLILDATNQELPTEPKNGNEAHPPDRDTPAEETSSHDAETNDPDPPASETPTPEQPHMMEDDIKVTDIVANEPDHDNEPNEPGKGPEPAGDNEDAAVKALDPSPETVEQLEPEAVTEDQAIESKDAPMESASSPADSGVEFDDDKEKGVETASNDIALDDPPATEVQASEPTQDPENSSHCNDDKSGFEGVAAAVEDASPEPAIADETSESSPEGKVDAIEDTLEEKALDDGANTALGNETVSIAADNNTGDAGGETNNAVDESTPAQAVLAPNEEGNYEPPSLESVPDDTKLDPLESAEAAAVPDEVPPEVTPEESPKAVEPTAELLASPNVSKSSSKGSHKHKADRLVRKHVEKPAKSTLQDKKVLERPHSHGTNGKESLRVKDRSPKSRRYSWSGEDDEERQRRKAARRLEEDTRRAEEERRRAEEEDKRRVRRAARVAAMEQAVKLEAEPAVKKGELVHRRHRERETDRAETRANREMKLPTFTLPPIPKALNLTSGESVHGATLIRAHGGAYRPVKDVSKTSAAKHRDEPEPKEKPKEPQKEPPSEAKQRSPPSSSGEKSHHKHRHRRHRSDGDRSSRHHDHRTRRPSVEERVEERPRSFLGGLVRI